MGRGLPLFTMICIGLGAISAIVIQLDQIALLAFSLIGVALGITVLLQKTQIMYVGGAVVLLSAILGVLGSIENLGTESGTLDLGISADVGRAVVMVGFVAAAATLLAPQWDSMEPEWLRYVAAVGIVGAIGLLIFTAEQLGTLAYSLNFLTGLLIVAAGIPAFTAFRDSE